MAVGVVVDEGCSVGVRVAVALKAAVALSVGVLTGSKGAVGTDVLRQDTAKSNNTPANTRIFLIPLGSVVLKIAIY